MQEQRQRKVSISVGLSPSLPALPSCLLFVNFFGPSPASHSPGTLSPTIPPLGVPINGVRSSSTPRHLECLLSLSLQIHSSLGAETNSSWAASKARLSRQSLRRHSIHRHSTNRMFLPSSLRQHSLTYHRRHSIPQNSILSSTTLPQLGCLYLFLQIHPAMGPPEPAIPPPALPGRCVSVSISPAGLYKPHVYFVLPPAVV